MKFYIVSTTAAYKKGNFRLKTERKGGKYLNLTEEKIYLILKKEKRNS